MVFPEVVNLPKSYQYHLGDGKNQSLLLGDSHAAVQYSSLDYKGYGENYRGAHGVTAFRYNGEYQDPITQLTYLRARDYNPETQTFITRDSYSVWNKYNFADADPIRHIDPTGHSSKSSRFFHHAGHWLQKYWPDVLMVATGLVLLGFGFKERRYVDQTEIQHAPRESIARGQRKIIVSNGRNLGQSGVLSVSPVRRLGEQNEVVLHIARSHSGPTFLGYAKIFLGGVTIATGITHGLRGYDKFLSSKDAADIALLSIAGLDVLLVGGGLV